MVLAKSTLTKNGQKQRIKVLRRKKLEYTRKSRPSYAKSMALVLGRIY